MKFQKILILLIISFSLNAYSSYSGVYYCTENDATGFSPKEDFKRTSFKGSKFKAKIDFEKEEVISEDIYFPKFWRQKCLVNDVSSISCISVNGFSFSFNPISRYFVHTNYFSTNKKPSDSIAVTYGTCEKF